MSGENDFAYPCGSGDIRDPCGLTKRELFAAMAMQGLSGASWTESVSADDIARYSVQQADALLAALAGASARQGNTRHE